MEEKALSREEKFVATVLTKCAIDNGYAARLRRASNPDTEYQSYDILAKFQVNLEKDYERLPFALIGASLASLQSLQDGKASLGKALKSCFDDGEQGELRLRRILACQSQEELCRILRPMLAFMANKATSPLCHSRLLKEMLRFTFHAQRIKLSWAQDYYGYQEDTPSKTAEAVHVS